MTALLAEKLETAGGASITSQDFMQVGSKDPVDLAKFDLSLRLIASTPDLYHALASAVERGTSVYINHNADVQFNPNTNTIHWDPNAAVASLHPNLFPAGVQSPMMSFLHELGHSLDDNIAINRTLPHAAWETQAEALAAGYELQGARALGQFQRDSHFMSKFVFVDNPTTNTKINSDGSLTWEKVLMNGAVQTGPAYTPEGYPNAPDFGTKGIGDEYGPGPEERAWEGSGGFDIPAVPAPSGTGEPADPTTPQPDPYDDGGDEPYDDGGGIDDGGEEGGGEGGNEGGGGGDGGYEGGGDGGDQGGGGGGDGSGGTCVHVDSLLPDGRRAGDVLVGSVMQLADQNSLERGTGVVSFSERKLAPGCRITTVTGVSLVCSHTAPIPTKQGLVLAPKLLGLEVPVRFDEAGREFVGWETVVKVEDVGMIYVQHITVGDKCFWAGEKAGAYILHHNLKVDSVMPPDVDVDMLIAATIGGSAGSCVGESLIAATAVVPATQLDVQIVGVMQLGCHETTLPI